MTKRKAIERVQPMMVDGDKIIGTFNDHTVYGYESISVYVLTRFGNLWEYVVRPNVVTMGLMNAKNHKVVWSR